MKNLQIVENRLKNMIVSDKKENPMRIAKVLKSEIVNVLKNYFEITCEDVNLDILIDENGKYDIQINVLSRAIKIANTFAD